VAIGALALGMAACGGGNGSGDTDLQADLAASGSSFEDPFIQASLDGFAKEAPNVNVNYDATGSGTGKKDFGKNTTDFAGTDSLVKPEDGIKDGSYVYVPTVAAPITISYNLPGVDKLQLSADTLADIFQSKVKTWNDQEIAKDNPDLKGKLPSTKITVAHRSDGSGTTSNFTTYLKKASKKWKLGAGETVEWPKDTQGGTKNTGVAQIIKQSKGAIGYVDLADAKETKLHFANVKNQAGKYVEPTLDAAAAAVEGAKVNDDVSYDPLNAKGDTAYPITSPTYLLLRTEYTDANKGKAVKAFVKYLLGDGQDKAESLNFAKLPDSLLEKAKAQLDKVKVKG
jgi:phosphate transport system substrate-binding protein